ncbi:uncharacterized protein KD926_003750 [Aspergillus affinis]|uniref:uncharacterized protein n=1 Tax=Aspergillus affinis TaxID=1070780 RepID=UPI0022FE5A2E|nr:uncharacterized protein KD926_003750 [Aspergillus affinis]KAI9035302.1 hypothetical protein KD926_003750 [Aspergillus affinis]
MVCHNVQESVRSAFSSSSISKNNTSNTTTSADDLSSTLPSSFTTSSSRQSSRGPSPNRHRQQKNTSPKLASRSPSPSRRLFHGSLTIKPREAALQYAKAAYATQFELSHPWHVFRADGSTGAGVVYSTDGRIENFVDHAYAVQGIWEIKCLEIFAVGAALRIALDRIEDDKKTNGHAHTNTDRHKVSVFTDSHEKPAFETFARARIRPPGGGYLEEAGGTGSQGRGQLGPWAHKPRGPQTSGSDGKGRGEIWGKFCEGEGEGKVGLWGDSGGGLGVIGALMRRPAYAGIEE